MADGKKEKIFQFDQVLPPEASNEEVRGQSNHFCLFFLYKKLII